MLAPYRMIPLGAAICGMAVALGAFGAHALEGRLAQRDDGPRAMETWDTASRYLMAHGLGLLALGIWAQQRAPERRGPRIAGTLLLAGCLLFSGSLFLVVLTQFRPLNFLVPLGGLSWLIGWAAWIGAAWGDRPADS